MTRFVVMGAPEGADRPGASPAGRGGPVFLRDRFSWLAFVLPPLWLALHRLWLAAAVALLLQAGLVALRTLDGFGFASFALLALFGAAVALEGPRLAIRRLQRRGFRTIAVIHAADLDEAERRLLELDPALMQAAGAVDTAVATPQARASTSSVPVGGGWRSGRTLLDTGGRA